MGFNWVFKGLSSYEDGDLEVFFKMCYLTMLLIAEITYVSDR